MVRQLRERRRSETAERIELTMVLKTPNPICQESFGKLNGVFLISLANLLCTRNTVRDYSACTVRAVNKC